MQHHYEHSVPKLKAVQGRRMVLVFCDGCSCPVPQDSGTTIQNLLPQSRGSNVNVAITSFSQDLKEGKCYNRIEMPHRR